MVGGFDPLRCIGALFGFEVEYTTWSGIGFQQSGYIFLVFSCKVHIFVHKINCICKSSGVSNLKKKLQCIFSLIVNVKTFFLSTTVLEIIMFERLYQLNIISMTKLWTKPIYMIIIKVKLKK